jgi:hypothetical protein
MSKFETAVDHIAESCIAVRLRLLNRVVTNLYDEALRPLKLKTAQMNILVVNGWLEVVPGDDARAQPFRLTASGKRLIEKAVPAWEKAQRQAEKLLGEPGMVLLDQAARRARTKPGGA